MHRVRRGFAAVALILSGCAGSGSHASLLPATNVPAPASAAGKGSAKFVINIPQKTAQSVRTPKFVSPATQSMTISVTQGAHTVVAPQTINLTPSSPGCAAGLAGTQCTQIFNLGAGTYVANVTAYDSQNGAGNQLSTAQGVAFTVAENTSNVVPLTLSGVPAQVVPTYLGSGQFSVVAQDADGNFIVGPGAPTYTVAKSSGSDLVTITQPTASAPNAFSLRNSATAPGTETMTVTAGFTAGTTNGCTTQSACTATFTVRVDPMLFVPASGGDSLYGYAIPFTSANEAPTVTISGLNGPYAVTTDANGNLYVTNETNIWVFAPPYTGTAAAMVAVSGAATLATGNGYLVASSGTIPGNVSLYKLPLTSGAAPTATLTTGIDGPESVAFDISGNLYVANYSGNNVAKYTYSSSGYATTPSLTISTNVSPAGVMFDASGNLWVTSSGGGASGNTGEVQEFTGAGFGSNPVTISSGIDYPFYSGGSFFDASGNLWVLNGSGTPELLEFTKPFSNSESATLTVNTGSGYPAAAFLDGAGNLYAATHFGTGPAVNGSIEQFGPGSTQPAFTDLTDVNYPYSATFAGVSPNLIVSL